MDNVLFLVKPLIGEAEVILDLLEVFGNALELSRNLAKNSASLICCAEMDILTFTSMLSCLVKELPIQYLGLPLSTLQLSKSVLQPPVDHFAGYIPSWKDSFLREEDALSW